MHCVLTVPGTPPSLNEFMRLHHHTRNDVAKMWYDIVSYSAGKHRHKRYNKVSVRLRYWFRDGYIRDPDNFAGKFLLDGLVRCGVLQGDSFANIDLYVGRGGIDRNNPRVEIEIRPWEEASA